MLIYHNYWVDLETSQDENEQHRTESGNGRQKELIAAYHDHHTHKLFCEL